MALSSSSSLLASAHLNNTSPSIYTSEHHSLEELEGFSDLEFHIAYTHTLTLSALSKILQASGSTINQTLKVLGVTSLTALWLLYKTYLIKDPTLLMSAPPSEDPSSVQKQVHLLTELRERGPESDKLLLTDLRKKEQKALQSFINHSALLDQVLVDPETYADLQQKQELYLAHYQRLSSFRQDLEFKLRNYYNDLPEEPQEKWEELMNNLILKTRIKWIENSE